jgi:5-methylcytosine-specific restriction endonuclease McrA
MNNKISSWVRQSRHRAKKHEVYNDLGIDEICELFKEFNGLCAYCGSNADTMDHSFPLSGKAPNVLANVLPICHKCKTIKGSIDLVAFFNNGHIDETKFLELLRGMLLRAGGDILKDHVKGITGIGL